MTPLRVVCNEYGPVEIMDTRWHAKQARVRERREKKAAEWKEFEDALFEGLMRRAGLNTQPRGDERAE